MIKTYKIRHRKDGQGWKFFSQDIFANSWYEAKKNFTEWVLGWLGEENNDHAIEYTDKIRAEYLRGEYLDTLYYDADTYTIKNVAKWLKTTANGK